MSEIRGEIADDFERIYRKAVQTLEAACDTTTEYSTVCTNPRCGKTIKVQGYPDVRAITTALQFLADQGIGKPTQAKDAGPKLEVTKPVTRMTTQERETLQAMAEQRLTQGPALGLATVEKAGLGSRTRASKSVTGELPPAA